jgi:hypothetical protein
MQLIELLRTKFVDGKTTIDPTELNEIKDELMQCDEFKESNLIIMQQPAVECVNEDGGEKIITASARILHNGTAFEGVSYLYSISLTPEIFDPNDVFKSIKDGCSITPLLYDAKTFLRYRKIILSSVQIDGNDNRKELHDKLDDILNNQREYMVKGKKSIMLRGVFTPRITKSNEPLENEYL